MKKKIGDLTLYEFRQIKDRCHNYKSCKECKEKDEICYKACDIRFGFDDEILDQEIEVEENE